MENNTNEERPKKQKPEALQTALDGFLNDGVQKADADCSTGTCIIKSDKSIVERINKKIITEDGRQLL